jgi:DNA-binding winged helix-turn-helix (wHTH) protein
MPQDDTIFEYSFHGYRVRTDDLTLRFHDAALPVAPKVVKTLLALLDNAGEVVTKDDLLSRVWGDAAVEEANLSQNIYSLRRLFHAASGESLIETLSRRGYVMHAAVVKRIVTAGAVTHRARDLRAFIVAAGASLVAGVVLIVYAYPTGSSDLPAGVQRAYDLGWYYWRGVTPTGIRTSIEQFDRVIQAAPRSPLGYAAEAVDYAKLSDLESPAMSVSYAAVADRFAQEAVAIDDHSAMAHAARGFVEWDLDSDNAAAVDDLKTAVALDPTNPLAHMWYGDALLWQADIGGARRQFGLAADIDPSLPGLDYTLGLTYYLSRDYADAAAFAKVGVSDVWSSEASRLLLSAAYDEARRYPAAIDALKPLASSASMQLAISGSLAHVYASMGDRSQARAALHVVERLSSRYPGRPVLTALAYASNGLPDEAFAWLSRLPHADRQVYALDPRFDSLHHDRRFAQWLHG